MKSKLWSSMSGLVAVGATWVCLPAPLAVAMLVIIFGHEMGHWIMAHLVGGRADLPIFIPLGIAIIGLTKIYGVPAAYKKWVYAAGPVVGSFLAGVLAGVAVGMAIPALVTAALSVGCFELYAGTLGSDGKKIRRSAQL